MRREKQKVSSAIKCISTMKKHVFKRAWVEGEWLSGWVGHIEEP